MKTVGRRQLGTQKDGSLQAGVQRTQLIAARQHAMPPLRAFLSVCLSFSFLGTWGYTLSRQQFGPSS